MDTKKTREDRGVYGGIPTGIIREMDRRRRTPGALLCDLSVFAISLFFARGHIFFGSYPLALAFVAILPDRVWIALIGAITGALSLGKSGVIHGIILTVTVFLRMVISGGKRGEGQPPFKEGAVMRIAAGTVGAFIGASYEILLGGLSFSTVAFGAASVLLTPLLSFSFLGLFSSGVGFRDAVYGEKRVFAEKRGEKSERVLYFQLSFLILSLLLCYCLDSYGFFGITLSYIYASFITLFVSRRFGAVRGMLTGFFTVVAVSPMAAVAFALCGAVSGLLFRINLGYALIGGGAALALWCGYAEGIGGFLAVFPEYAASGILFSPVLKLSRIEEGASQTQDEGINAEWMVNRAAQAYRLKVSGFRRLSESFLSAARAVREFGGAAGGDYEDHLRIVERVVLECGLTPCEEIKNKIATKLYKNVGFSTEELAAFSRDGVDSAVLARISECVVELRRSATGIRDAATAALDMELFARAVNDSSLSDASERGINEELTALALEVLRAEGFPDGDVKVFGKRRLHILAAGPDPEGRVITRPELKEGLERRLGINLSPFEFYRKDKLCLLEGDRVASYSVAYATRAACGAGSDISGDAAVFFERDGFFFSLISDGMGSGEKARRVSELVCGYLSARAGDPAFFSTVIAPLNSLLRRLSEECLATVDLFCFDLLTGEAVFIKSGAAPSYVKRGASLFRIRSRSAPIGVLRAPDAERIGCEVRAGDVVVMLSDGISSSIEDSPALVELLSGMEEEGAEGMCRKILDFSAKKSSTRDDMTVSVIKITKKAP